MVFCRETVLAKGIICKTETKTAKVSVTAEICHKIQCLETVHFVSLLEGREGERHNKQSPKWIILRSSFLDGKYNAYVYKSKDTKKIIDF